MLADIATGNSATADVLFLIAAILFAVATIILAVAARRDQTALAAVAVPAGLCLISVAWLIL